MSKRPSEKLIRSSQYSASMSLASQTRSSKRADSDHQTDLMNPSVTANRLVMVIEVLGELLIELNPNSSIFATIKRISAEGG
jgi:hypothetical protein